MEFILTSNIFLFFPVIAATFVGEWIYFTIAFGASIFSPIYHYLKERNSRHITFFHAIKEFDWFFGICAYAYMYYFIFAKVNIQFQIPLAIALSLTLMFFWYGFKLRSGSYKRTHPWFHVVTSIISGIIVLSK